MKPKKILVIEKNETIRLSLIATLMGKGFDVIGAKNEVEAIAEGFSEKPDLILLCTSAPRFKKVVLMKEFRNSCDWGKNVPFIVVIDGMPSDKVMSEIKKYSPLLYLFKSQTSLELIAQKVQESLLTLN